MPCIIWSLRLVFIFIYCVVFNSNPFPFPAVSASEIPGKSNVIQSFESVKGIKGVKPCGDNSLGNVTALYMTGCDAAPCRIGKNDRLDIFVEGILAKPHSALIATFLIRIGSIKFPIARLNACDHIAVGGKCPLEPYKKYLFAVHFDVRKYHYILKVSLDVTLELAIKDESTNDEICGTFGAKFDSL